MKILCITDSLGLPRVKPEQVSQSDTWVYLLRNSFEVETLSLGGGVLKDFTSQLEYLKMYQPDAVILQLGIVDCAPRALTKLENHLINKYYITRELANKLLPKVSFFLRKKRGVSYTKINDYKKGLAKIKRTFSCNVFCIPILPASSEYEKLLPGISKKVTLYNETLKNIFGTNFIDLEDFEHSFIMSDNIHLNKKGHLYLANRVCQIVKK